jgi:heterodisulfide reductase subunit C
MKMEGSLAGVLVNWFLKLKVFEQGDHFAKIMETLAARKKALEKSNVSAWENRLLARNMTAGAFRESLKG